MIDRHSKKEKANMRRCMHRHTDNMMAAKLQMRQVKAGKDPPAAKQVCFAMRRGSWSHVRHLSLVSSYLQSFIFSQHVQYVDRFDLLSRWPRPTNTTSRA